MEVKKALLAAKDWSVVAREMNSVQVIGHLGRYFFHVLGRVALATPNSYKLNSINVDIGINRNGVSSIIQESIIIDDDDEFLNTLNNKIDNSLKDQIRAFEAYLKSEGLC